MSITLLLVDDHALLRQGLRSLLERVPDVEVLGEAGNGREGIRVAGELKPAIVLLDIAMPEMGGLEALPRLLRLSPAPRVILLSMHASETHVIAGVRAGAAGFLPKNAPFEHLLEAIRTVAAGGHYLPPSLSEAVWEAINRLSGPDEAGGGDPASSLTPRQRIVLQLVGEGRTTREIAARLNLSEKTIEAQRAQIRERLGVADTAGLVRYAVRIGLVAPE